MRWLNKPRTSRAPTLDPCARDVNKDALPLNERVPQRTGTPSLTARCLVLAAQSCFQWPATCLTVCARPNQHLSAGLDCVRAHVARALPALHSRASAQWALPALLHKGAYARAARPHHTKEHHSLPVRAGIDRTVKRPAMPPLTHHGCYDEPSKERRCHTHINELKRKRGSAGTSKCTPVTPVTPKSTAGTPKSTAGTLSTVCLSVFYLYAHCLACCLSSFPANRFARRPKRFAFCSATICPNGLHTV